MTQEEAIQNLIRAGEGLCQSARNISARLRDVGGSRTQSQLWASHVDIWEHALAALSSAPPDLDEMQRRWSRCVERSDRQQAALEAWNDYMGERFSEGPESDALHPRAAAIWRQVREALASVAAPAPPVAETPRTHYTEDGRVRAVVGLPVEQHLPPADCALCGQPWPASPVVAPAPVVEDKHTAYAEARRDWLGVRAAVGSGPAVTAAYRRMEALRPLDVATPPDVPSLLDRLETHYDFACEAGPLKNCIEWQQLRTALSRALAEQQAQIATLTDKLALAVATTDMTDADLSRTIESIAERMGRAMEAECRRQIDAAESTLTAAVREARAETEKAARLAVAAELRAVASWMAEPGHIWKEDAVDECRRVLRNRAQAVEHEGAPLHAAASRAADPTGEK